MSKGEWRKLNAKAGATSIRILANHWRWLEDNGYTQQAENCKNKPQFNENWLHERFR